MLKRIIKRNGTVEDFTPHKVNMWSQWASGSLGNRVDWSRVVLETIRQFGEEADSQDLQRQLIKTCLGKRSWPYNLMAGKLYIAIYRKEIYGDEIPTIQALQQRMCEYGLMRQLDYSDEEYVYLETIIDHTRDFNLAHFQIHQIRKKYSLQDRVTAKEFETPQFVFMRMAMALGEDEPKESRLMHVKNWYNHFSFNRINAPTPNYVNLGTTHNGYASCCLYAVDDNAQSLAIGDHIAYTMTYMSAGIGGIINTRSLGDPVRNGTITHQGKLPYYRSLAGAVKANLQGGRGGACTTYFSCFDPEALTIINLQNPRSTRDKQNRDIHFAIMFNRLFAVKVMKNEDVFTFNIKTAPDLMAAFFDGDSEKFDAIYSRYENDPHFKKNYVSARKILLTAGQQSFDVGTLYYFIVDEANRHTPFKDPIHSSNLCNEISEPTRAYSDMRDLYSENDVSYVKFLTNLGLEMKVPGNLAVTTSRGLISAIDIVEGDQVNDVIVKSILEKKASPEVALCSLAALVEPNIKSDEEYASAAYYSLKMIDKCIHLSDYALPHIGFTAKRRLNAGVGLMGVATRMAKLGLKYDTQAGLDKLHQISERHAYFLIKASLQLGQELGTAPWMHKTKWPEGWLPIDTYKKAVDELAAPIYRYDWEALRQEVILSGGLRNSTLIAHMPGESSSKASGCANGIYPVRDLNMKKTDAHNAIDWCAVDDDIYGDQYQSAWEIDSVDMVKAYSVIQKFTDQSISADLYRDRTKEINITTDEIINVFKAMIKYGLKSRYYQNSLTSKQPASSDDEPEHEDALQEPNSPAVCGSGGCTL